ncbi:MAG TPA: NUDIX domain-containing protein [Patescibacteria group bacterium]|nr:NUDIX domain-containing protein [Patescibacteria group bacterium]
MSAEHGVEKIATRAIIVINNKVLLGKRGGGGGEGQFALIGGKPDGKETPAEAVVREVQEETGLIFTNPILFFESKNSQTIPGQTWHTFYFLGETSGELNLKKDEVPEVVYVNENNLKSIDIAFDHREILIRFFASN